MDDILITGETEQQHLQNLVAVLERLKTAGVKLKKSKCLFIVPEVEYLGHKVNSVAFIVLLTRSRPSRTCPNHTM